VKCFHWNERLAALPNKVDADRSLGLPSANRTRKVNMQKLIAFGLLFVGVSIALPAPVGVPEISPASGMNALALIGGSVLILRSRRKK
jgi:hypothetical protein